MQEIYAENSMHLMPKLAEEGIRFDLILTDPPYGTTSARWDEHINFEELWTNLNRLLKPGGVIVMTSAQPFTTLLIMSNLKDYRYNWVWKKNRATNFQNAKRMPMRITEDVCVFGGKNYFPQGLVKYDKVKTNGRNVGGEIVRGDIETSVGKGTLRTPGSQYVQEWTNYPNNFLEFPLDKEKLHPTQKPVALFEYLIKTYCPEGGSVLDPYGGSCTTAVAAKRAGRDFIVIEQSKEYVEIGRKRLEELNGDYSDRGQTPQG